MTKHTGYTLLIIVFFGMSTSVFAQRFQGAVMGGMNLSQVDGDEVYGFKRVGGHIGLGVILPIKKWDITLETVFNQKGAIQKDQYQHWVYDSVGNTVDSTQYTGAYNLRLNYVEIPLIAHFTDRGRYTVGAGFSYGRLVSFSEIEHDGSIPPYSDTVKFNKNDYNIIFDLQIRIWRQLKFNLRYSYSLASIRERTFHDVIYQLKDPWTRKQYNNMLTFRLVYVFNEQYEPAVRSEP